MDRKKDFEKVAQEQADAIYNQPWVDQLTRADLVEIAEKCLEYGYKCGREDMAHTMSIVVQGKLMTFTNDENERILPTLPLAMFITEIYNESMSK